MEEIINGLQEQVNKELEYMRFHRVGQLRTSKILNECLVIRDLKNIIELEETKTKLITQLVAYIGSCDATDRALDNAKREVMRMYAERIDYDAKGVQAQEGNPSGSAG